MPRKLLNALFVICIFISNTSYSNAKDPVQDEDSKIKLGASYELNKKQKINLRITEIPKKYPWIEKDLKGKTVNPNYDSIVVAENAKAIKIKDSKGDSYTIPANSKFFAKVGNVIPAKRFWRKEKVKLEFFAIAVSDGTYDEYFEETSFSPYDGRHNLEPQLSTDAMKLDNNLSFDSAKDGKGDSVLKNIGMLGAYTLGGALAGPVMLFSISSIVGAVTTVSAFSNPYVVGGAAAVGATVGLALGIMRKGGDMKIEPGQEISISLNDSWAITKLLDPNLKNKSTLVAEKINNKMTLDITKVKKIHDGFGDPALKITFDYINRTDLPLTYTSFQLVDSTGKAYEADAMSLNPIFFEEELPKQGSLDLVFTIDYPKATHQLKVLSPRSRKTLIYKKVILD